jgi:tetratricopeptide (TPR) repeat protein
LVRLGRHDEARSAYLKGYPLARRNASLRVAVGQHIEFCALTGNEARGLEILAEHAAWLSDQGENVTHRYEFCGSVAVLLRRLVALGYGEIPVGGGSAVGVLATLEKELAGISARYDRRNGNTFVSERHAARLAQEPLTDWLPLGVSAALPDVAVSAAGAVAAVGGPSAGASSARAASEPWEVVRPTAVQAEEELRDGDPVAAEKLAREALRRGGTLLPQEAAARLYSLLAEALRRQPERGLDLVDAALKASARWDGLSEPDMLHQRFTAAAAYRGLGRHAEAVALLEDVIGRVEVPYERLAVAQTRRQYGESLRELRRHPEAAEQLLQAAALLEGDESNERAYAEVAWLAAECLQYSGRRPEALAAFERAASLWEALGEPVAAVRCRRSIAWLVFADEPQRAVELMRAVLDGMSRTEESAAEVEETQTQLDRIVEQAARRAEIAASGYDEQDDEY